MEEASFVVHAQVTDPASILDRLGEESDYGALGSGRLAGRARFAGVMVTMLDDVFGFPTILVR